MSLGQHDDGSFANSELGRRVFSAPVKLLEFNPSRLNPWLTVTSAQDEIAMQAGEEVIDLRPIMETEREAAGEMRDDDLMQRVSEGWGE